MANELVCDDIFSSIFAAISLESLTFIAKGTCRASYVKGEAGAAK